jgi:hypothetical protein
VKRYQHKTDREAYPEPLLVYDNLGSDDVGCWPCWLTVAKSGGKVAHNWTTVSPAVLDRYWEPAEVEVVNL